MSISIKKRIMIEAKLKRNEPIVSVKFDDGIESCYHGIWLRDHCKCPNCKHSISKQRLIDTSKIPIDIKPESLTLNGNELRINWPDGHQSSFESIWLHHNSYNPNIIRNKKNYMLWGKDLINHLPTVSYADVMNEDGDGLKRWLNHIVFRNLY